MDVPLPSHVLDRMVRHHGLVTRRELLQARVPSDTVESWIRRGRLSVIQRGVYRLPGAPIPVEQPLYAAVLRSRGWLTAEPALALLDVRGCERTAPPVIAVERERVITGVDFEVRRYDLRKSDRSRIGVIAATLPGLATLDALVGQPDDRARSIVDAALWKGVTDLVRLRALAGNLGGHEGAQRFAGFDRAGAFGVESEGERLLEAFLGPFAVLFRPQADDIVPGRRIDRYDDASRLGLEYHGGADHTAEEDRASDGLRDLELRDSGDIEVLVLTYGMVTGAAAPVTLARVLSIRARRLARLAAA